jgi:hypothetical protein
MKTARRTLALVISTLLVLSAASAAAQTAGAAAARFSSSDMTVSSLLVQATEAEAKSLFGEPQSTETIEVPATGEVQNLWYYDGVTLTFSSEGKLVGAVITAPDIAGPRGVEVGDPIQEVVNAFYVDPESGTSAVLYSAGYVESLDAQLPPFGVTMRNEDGTFVLWYLDPVQPYGEDVLADPAQYLFQSHDSLLFLFGGASTVTSISWSVGALAE